MLDIAKLQNLKRRNGIIIAQCPACAEEGKDHKGEHLFIDLDGRFGCVLYPGENGRLHRRKVFELVGVREKRCPLYIKVRPVKCAEAPEVIENNVLGRLGHFKLSRTKIENIKEANIIKEAFTLNKPETDPTRAVPSVPEDSCIYTLKELLLLQSFDEASLRIIHYAKFCFNGTIIPTEDGKRV